MFRKRSIALAAAAAVLALASPASARDYAATALNIIPSGQYGAVPPPPGADLQARMYDGLTPLFDRVTPGDVRKYFKSEALGAQGQVGVEPTPRPGLRIVRDHFNVPHITGTTRDDATWGAGWIVAEDRGLLLSVARGAAHLAAVDPPGIDAFGLVKQLRPFTPSAQTDAFLARQTGLLMHSGPKGRQLLHDIDVYLEGINAQLSAQGSTAPPWTRVDIYGTNALLARFLGQGGGDEARRSEFLDGLKMHLGDRRGAGVFDDLSERNDPETVNSIDGRFPYGSVPVHHTGNVVIDNGSFTPAASAAAERAARAEQHASNILMVSGRRSTNGHPLFVGGPQINYFYPGLTLEMDVKAPGETWRGATSVPFPGYVLIGRGEDFAVTLTSAGGDIIDQFAETLCGDDTHYRFKGRCRKMGTFDAGKLGASGSEPARELVFRTTVHGPVAGYATTGGRRVAITSARSSRGREVLFQLAFQDVSLGRVRGPKSFYRAFGTTPLTFNAFYADSRQTAEYTAGRLPLRAAGVDPRLPTEGTGGHEWRGFLDPDAHPHGTGPRAGVMTNWNNRAARDFPASDSQWGYTPVHRDELLLRGLAKRRKHNLATVVGAMNAAATEDLRAVEFVPTLAAVLKTGAPNARDARMLALLEDWNAKGGSRLDRDLDGKIDHPGAAILDGAWTGLANAVMRPALGKSLTDQLATLVVRFDNPVDQQLDGWTGYMDKDLRTLLGRPVKGRYHARYCGTGNLARCRAALWAALDAAGDRLQAKQGPNPDAWRHDATAERHHFQPIDLHPIRYTNRPTGIQQVITFDGHR